MLSLKSMIERDLIPNDENYQVISFEGLDCAYIKKQNNKKMDICLYTDSDDYFNWSLIQFALTKDDIKNNRFFIMGYIIKNTKNVPVGSLIVKFIPFKNDIDYENLNGGKFNIILSNTNDEHDIIEEFNRYPGDKNIIYILSSKLKECFKRIIKENFEK